MHLLDELEARSVAILREAYLRVSPLCMLWSMGKDSAALLWLARKAFLGNVLFPVVLLDTGMELPEVYAFRDELARGWQLDLHNEPCPPEFEMDPTLPPATRAAARQTAGLRTLVERQGYRGVIAGPKSTSGVIRNARRSRSCRSI